MTTKTYSNRTNARRAGVAAGTPAELVQITVHKDGDKVRFGWKAKEASAKGPHKRAQGAASTPAASAARSRPVAAPAAAQREERNGVKRPKAGGLCAQVWDWLDAHPTATIKEAKAAAPEHDWNENNVSCEFYAWRKFKWAGDSRMTTVHRPCKPRHCAGFFVDRKHESESLRSLLYACSTLV
ncbi:hypothetical protein [Cupriavidus plantarum]|uniref:hypothetical protein n=1 Tax=Cupriavidus plantarum TaxID=942865 RepID=UPI000F1CA081|nr:hypothetical protein [Cupriavidus plantarum]RLK44533.1 hypothetical protein C7417_0514 [Cupriavidus plantarum]